ALPILILESKEYHADRYKSQKGKGKAVGEKGRMIVFELWEKSGDPVPDSQLGKRHEEQPQILDRPEGAQLGSVQGMRVQPENIDISQDHADIGKDGGLDTLLGDFTHCRKVEKNREFLRTPGFFMVLR